MRAWMAALVLGWIATAGGSLTLRVGMMAGWW